MRDIAVTEFKGEKFEILSCEPIISFKENNKEEVLVNASAIQRILSPLIRHRFSDSFVKEMAKKTLKAGLDLCKKEEESIYELNFKDPNSHQKYKIFFHKVPPNLFTFLWRHLSEEEMEKIERESAGKTLIDADLIKSLRGKTNIDRPPINVPKKEFMH